MRHSQPSDDTETVLVTFRLPPDVTAESAFVVGDFNDWSTTAHPMTKDTDGGFATALTLEPGRTYRFRYLLDGERWENDWAADAYVPNEFGGEDSVIDLTDATVGAEPAAEPAPTNPPPRAVKGGS